MKRGNWVPVTKAIVSMLPKHRPYTEAEAFLSVSIDVDNLIHKTAQQLSTPSEAIELLMSHNTISAYAALWGWTRNRVRRFFAYIRTESGHPTDTRRTGSGHPIRLIIKTLQDNADRYRTDSGQIADTSNKPQTLNLNPKSLKRPSRAAHETDAFMLFYAAYPKKRNKPQALKAWNKINPTPDLAQEIMAGLEKAKACEEWNREAGRFIPHPATWLNAKAWQDEYTPLGTNPIVSASSVGILGWAARERQRMEGFDGRTEYPVDIE